MPSPPPPYSPGQNPNITQTLGSSPHSSGNAFPQHPPPPPPPTSAPSSARPVSGYQSRPGSMVIPSSATSITSNPQFPPPPPRNGPGRSASRDKLSSKFSLSSFRNRNNEHSPAPSAIDSLRINTSEAIQRAPASPGLVAQRAASQYVFLDAKSAPKADMAIASSQMRLPSGGTVPRQIPPCELLQRVEPRLLVFQAMKLGRRLMSRQ